MFNHHQEADKVIISVSGGKDSTALMIWALNNFPKEKLICAHAIIDIDWSCTLDIVKEQCDFFDLPLITVQAIDKQGKKKGFLDQLTAPRIDRKTGEVKEYQFPSLANRWCTSILKTGPLDKLARTFEGNVLVLIGERREESNQRAKLEEWRPDSKLTKKDGTRNVVKMSPILDMKEDQVWAQIHHTQAPIHPCYSWGVTRASCAICIFSSNKEIAIAAQKDPEIVKRYLEAEKKISHTFHYKKTKRDGEVKETVAQILTKQNAFPV